MPFGSLGARPWLGMSAVEDEEELSCAEAEAAVSIVQMMKVTRNSLRIY
jgi:hypothetical protein